MNSNTRIELEALITEREGYIAENRNAVNKEMERKEG